MTMDGRMSPKDENNGRSVGSFIQSPVCSCSRMNGKATINRTDRQTTFVHLHSNRTKSGPEKGQKRAKSLISQRLRKSRYSIQKKRKNCDKRQLVRLFTPLLFPFPLNFSPLFHIHGPRQWIRKRESFSSSGLRLARNLCHTWAIYNDHVKNLFSK